jgi:hypothetical protein
MCNQPRTIRDTEYCIYGFSLTSLTLGNQRITIYVRAPHDVLHNLPLSRLKCLAPSFASTFPQTRAGYSVAWILMQYLIECAQMVHLAHSLIHGFGHVIGVRTNTASGFIVVVSSLRHIPWQFLASQYPPVRGVVKQTSLREFEANLKCTQCYTLLFCLLSCKCQRSKYETAISPGSMAMALTATKTGRK